MSSGWNASSKAAAEEGGFSQSNGQAASQCQRLQSDLCRTMFQQKKRAEELANGMDVRNTALEKLCYKVKEEEIITASPKAASDEVATWAAKCAEQKPKFPSSALCYSVSVALRALPVVKMQQQENQQLELE